MSLSRQEELEQFHAFEEIVADLKTRIAGSSGLIPFIRSFQYTLPHLEQITNEIQDLLADNSGAEEPNRSWLVC